METVRVDICYRPLRIGWAIGVGDMDSFRAAARVSFALWGGRFNPIIVVDQQEHAGDLIDVFRVDVILPLGDSEKVKSFPKKFPYLITPHGRQVIGNRLSFSCRFSSSNCFSRLASLSSNLPYFAFQR